MFCVSKGTQFFKSKLVYPTIKKTTTQKPFLNVNSVSRSLWKYQKENKMALKNGETVSSYWSIEIKNGVNFSFSLASGLKMIIFLYRLQFRN